MGLGISEAVGQRIKHAKRVVVLTGGGMAAESGVPTFREALVDGWERYDVSELATPQAFARNPRLVWEWYSYRRRHADGADPSPSHRALVRLEDYFPRFTLVTQTIDSLHWRAGSHDVIELNGCLRRARCFECGAPALTWDDEQHVPPHCPSCGGPLRPDVVLFGEGLPQHQLRRAQQAVESCDLFVCVGTVAPIEPVTSFPFVARRAGALTVTIAPEDSIYAVMADVHLAQTPGRVLSELVQMIVGSGQEN